MFGYTNEEIRPYLFQFAGAYGDKPIVQRVAAAAAAAVAGRRSCFCCSVVSLKRYQDRSVGGRRSHTPRDIDGSSPATDQRVTGRPIAFQTDATTMETTTALLPWQRRWSWSHSFDRVPGFEAVSVK